MKRFFVALAIWMALLIPLSASADSAIKVTSTQFINNFRSNMQFQLNAGDSVKITQVALFVQIDGVASSARQIPDFTPDTNIKATYTWNLTQNYVPPGISGQYWWTLQDEAGNQLTTPKAAFRLDDPAHKWQKLSNDKVALYWYNGASSFGQSLFDQANKAIAYLQSDTGVTVDRQVQILIYGSHSDLLNALAVGSQEWTGGENFPDYGVVLIGVEPSNLDWGLGATTHELTHQIIHQKVRGPLGDLALPHWMDEGLAVYYENPGTLDSQFRAPLQRAIQSNTLLPLRTLNSNFPADSYQATLAYGESWAVVDFIIRHYGKSKLAELLQEFKTGGYYDDIFVKVLGVDTDGLENQWRQDAGAQPRVIPTRSSASPTPFPTFGLSTGQEQGTAPTQVAQAATATPPAAGAQPVPTQATGGTGTTSGAGGSGSANPLSNLCGGVFGLIALGIFGATLHQRRR